VENVIAEAVKFFNLNALSSPILVKVHFDVIMTMIADTLYSQSWPESCGVLKTVMPPRSTGSSSRARPG
jgi:hypothetical protein